MGSSTSTSPSGQVTQSAPKGSGSTQSGNIQASAPPSGPLQSSAVQPPIQQQVSGPPPTALGPPLAANTQLPPTMSYGGGAYTPQLGALAGRVPIQPHTAVDSNAALNPYLTNVQNTIAATQLPKFDLAKGVAPLNQDGVTPTVGQQILDMLKQNQQPGSTTFPPADPAYNG